MKSVLILLGIIIGGRAIAGDRDAPQPVQAIDIPDELVLQTPDTIEMATPKKACKSMMNYCRKKTPNDCRKEEHCVIDGKHHGAGPWVGTCQCR